MAEGLEKKIDERIAQLMELERRNAELLQAARYQLMDAQDEIRVLRAETLKMTFEYFTEAQAADRLHISKDTMARLRRAKRIPCVMVVPKVYRYTSEQLIEIARLLEVPAKRKKLAA